MKHRAGIGGKKELQSEANACVEEASAAPFQDSRLVEAEQAEIVEYAEQEETPVIPEKTVVKKREIGFGTLTLLTVLAVFLMIIGSMEGMRMVGKAALSVTVSETGAVPQNEKENGAKESETLYRGNSYILNEDLVTVLVMGIDKEIVTRVGGQSRTARLRNLRPIDDDFMRCLFKDNIPLEEFVLRIITDKPDLLITDCETQKDMKRLVGAR